MRKFLKVFYSQIFNAFFPVLIVTLLLKLPNQEYTASIFLLINFANVYLLFTDYSSNITFIRNALQSGGIRKGYTAPRIVKNIHEYLGLKFILLAAGFFIWIFLCFTIPVLSEHALSNLLSYLFIAGYNLNFYWIYMSSSKEYFFIMSNFATRLMLVVLLLIFSTLKLNFFFLMPVTGIIVLLIAFLFFYRFIRVHQIKFHVSGTTLHRAIGVIKKDWPLVANSFLLMSPTTCLSIFIGFVKNTRYVIVYGFAEKIFFGIRSLLSVFVNSIYPIMCRPGGMSRKNLIKIYAAFYIVLLCGFALLYYISPFITSYFNLVASEVDIYNTALKYFMLTLFTVALNVPVFIWLLVRDIIRSKKAFAVFAVVTVLIVLVFSLNVILNNGITGIVQSLWASESLVLLAFIVLYKRSRSQFSAKTIVPTAQNVPEIS